MIHYRGYDIDINADVIQFTSVDYPKNNFAMGGHKMPVTVAGIKEVIDSTIEKQHEEALLTEEQRAMDKRVEEQNAAWREQQRIETLARVKKSRATRGPKPKKPGFPVPEGYAVYQRLAAGRKPGSRPSAGALMYRWRPVEVTVSGKITGWGSLDNLMVYCDGRKNSYEGYLWHIFNPYQLQYWEAYCEAERIAEAEALALADRKGAWAFDSELSGKTIKIWLYPTEVRNNMVNLDYKSPRSEFLATQALTEEGVEVTFAGASESFLVPRIPDVLDACIAKVADSLGLAKAGNYYAAVDVAVAINTATRMARVAREAANEIETQGHARFYEAAKRSVEAKEAWDLAVEEWQRAGEDH